MAKYSIEETTLTSIGDALRRKHGETKSVLSDEKITKISKTQNATGFDSWEGAYEIHDNTNMYTYNVVRIEGASSIHVKMAYQTKAQANAYVQVAAGECPDNTFPSGLQKYGGQELTTIELDFENTDVVTFRFRNIMSSSENYLGYYAEVSGYPHVEVKNTYSSAEMAQAIDDIEVGVILPEEAFSVSGKCSYRFAQGGWDWFIESFRDRITTKDITYADYMFSYSKIKTLPFDINFKDGGGAVNRMFDTSELEEIPSIDFRHTTTYQNAEYLFGTCKNLKQIGTLKNLYPSSLSYMFSNCQNLRFLPEFENLNMNRIYTYNYASCSSMFSNCYSLRNVNEEFLKKIYNPVTTSATSIVLYSTFSNCYSLDEVRGLNPQTGKLTSNSFNSTFSNCCRLKDMIFATQEDGSIYVVNWSKQTIDLNVGYATASSKKYIIDYNSGITADKEVTDDASYQALKDDPDWFATNIAYSRYNKESAINTIDSLPDASAGTGNVIKFKGAAGSATDGGAIQDMDEAMIALAASKGFTVTFA